jgi:hypothetical protein
MSQPIVDMATWIPSIHDFLYTLTNLLLVSGFYCRWNAFSGSYSCVLSAPVIGTSSKDLLNGHSFSAYLVAQLSSWTSYHWSDFLVPPQSTIIPSPCCGWCYDVTSKLILSPILTNERSLAFGTCFTNSLLNFLTRHARWIFVRVHQRSRVNSLSCCTLSNCDKELVIQTRQNSMNVELLWEVAQSILLHSVHFVILRFCVFGFRIRLSFWIGIGQLVHLALEKNLDHLHRLYLN